MTVRTHKKKKHYEIPKEEAVKYLYQMLLNREPENQSVVMQKIKHDDFFELISEFIESNEFQKSLIDSSMNIVNLDVDEVNFLNLCNRVVKQWTKLGIEKPYWSVISDAKFMPNQFEKFSTEFWESGITAVDKIFDKCKSLGLEIKKDGIGLELGAGVGRLTFPLAKRIEKLLALDVSVSNLAVLKEKNQFFENIQPILIENLDDIKKFEKIDLFISLITLQHNPPPIQEFILKNIFKTFNHGAIGVFQIPIQTPHFKFNTEEFLNSSEREMDMFSFPLSRIYEICREVDVSVVHVEQDNLAGPKHLSCTFFIRKN